MKSPLHILHLEDDPNDAALIEASLEAEGISCTTTLVHNRAAYVAALQKGGIDLVLSDYSLPGFDGLSALEIARSERPELPVILVSGTLGEERAVEALKSGATDYVLKQRLSRLPIAVQRAMREVEGRDDRLRLELLFAEAQKMEIMGQLAGGIAHDFNNILCAIVGYAGMTRMEVHDMPAAKSYVEQIEIASKRATELVTQILSFSRRQEQQRKPIQLKHILREAIQLLRASFPSTIKIEYNLMTTPTVLANPTAIHQVVMNLCTNARHSIGTQQGSVKIELAPFKVNKKLAVLNPDLLPGTYVKISVTDSGCGMDRDTIGRIFEPFFTTKPPGEGTGLGLAAVHGIMKRHDGGITVDSTPGKGTVFHLYFPVFETDLVVVEKLSERIPRGNGERILFVDDEVPLAALGKKILETLGYSVTTASSVGDAIDAFAQCSVPYDLVITDFTMPVMDGLEFARKLWQSKPGFPVILTTGYSESLNQESVRDLGFRELLMKPNSIQTLGEAVHRVLAQ